MYTIDNISDYIISRLTKGTDDRSLNPLKLQKLLYYVQSWHLAFEKTPFFEGKFNAWVHGPVNRDIYDRFRDKMLFFPLDSDNIKDINSIDTISSKDKLYIDSILESYAIFSGVQLEDMTHNEEPWIQARKGYKPNERCDVVIDEKLMGDYYRARLS